MIWLKGNFSFGYLIKFYIGFIFILFKIEVFKVNFFGCGWFYNCVFLILDSFFVSFERYNINNYRWNYLRIKLLI